MTTLFPTIGPQECRRYIAQARAEKNAVVEQIDRLKAAKRLVESTPKKSGSIIYDGADTPQREGG
jgi:hypothetical protein